MLCHAADSLIWTFPQAAPLLQPLPKYGGVGVMMFFGISGLLIGSRLLSDMERKAGLTSFYIRRVFRILPPLYAFLGVCAVLSAYKVLQIPFNDILRAAVFASNYWS